MLCLIQCFTCHFFVMICGIWNNVLLKIILHQCYHTNIIRTYRLFKSCSYNIETYYRLTPFTSFVSSSPCKQVTFSLFWQSSLCHMCCRLNFTSTEPRTFLQICCFSCVNSYLRWQTLWLCSDTTCTTYRSDHPYFYVFPLTQTRLVWYCHPPCPETRSDVCSAKVLLYQGRRSTTCTC